MGSGTEIGNSLRIRFRRPTSAQLSRAVKADEISVVEPTQPLRLTRQSKIIERLDFCPSLIFLFFNELFVLDIEGSLVYWTW